MEGRIQTLRPSVKSNRIRCPQSVAVVELSNDIVGHHAFARKALYSLSAKPVAQSNVELVSAEPLLNLGIFEWTKK